MTSRTSSQQPINEKQHTVDIGNAGLVLLHNHLQMLFDMCGYLNQRRFKDPSSAHRAVHLLQYLATGEENVQGNKLALNKLLCGLPLTHSVDEPVTLSDSEKELCVSLLRSVISQWTILNNTSIEGLRGSFIIRNGKLDLSATDSIKLDVERHAFDLLIDRLPWAYTPICFPWMIRALNTHWR